MQCCERHSQLFTLCLTLFFLNGELLLKKLLSARIEVEKGPEGWRRP
jgi:hypothetical protein